MLSVANVLGATLTLRKKALPLLFLVVALLPSFASAQKLEKVTGLKLEYWRSFHGVIQQEIRITNTGEIALNSTILRRMTEAHQNENQKHTVKTLTERDMNSLLTLFNSGDARQFFATTKAGPQIDGSSLSITITQNSFSITFTSLDAFDPKAPRFATALGRVALDLFTKAGITIPKSELY